jgi:hypothetical protein
VADIVAGAALPPTICKCEDAAYCAVVAAGSYSVPGQVGGWLEPAGGQQDPPLMRAGSRGLLAC